MDTLFSWLALWKGPTNADQSFPSSPIVLPMDKTESFSSEKCELRIEGMTCGSCVEACCLCTDM